MRCEYLARNARVRAMGFLFRARGLAPENSIGSRTIVGNYKNHNEFRESPHMACSMETQTEKTTEHQMETCCFLPGIENAKMNQNVGVHEISSQGYP